MTTTEVQTPVNATQPDRYIAFGGARVLAGIIDMALVATVAAPLAIIHPGLAVIAGFVGAAAYSAVLEGGPSGQTVGKRKTGVRVVDAANGGSIGHVRALVRHVVRLPFIGFGFLMFLSADPGRQTWYDWALRARVVRTEAQTDHR